MPTLHPIWLLCYQYVVTWYCFVQFIKLLVVHHAIWRVKTLVPKAVLRRFFQRAAEIDGIPHYDLQQQVFTTRLIVQLLSMVKSLFFRTRVSFSIQCVRQFVQLKVTDKGLPVFSQGWGWFVLAKHFSCNLNRTCGLSYIIIFFRTRLMVSLSSWNFSHTG